MIKNNNIAQLYLTLSDCFDFLKNIIKNRLKQYISSEEFSVESSLVFTNPESDDILIRFIKENAMKGEELVTILLSLAPHIYANFFDAIINEFFPNGGEFPEFGGIRGINHRGIIPTSETALFILAGNDLERRMEVMQLFNNEHWFAKKQILTLEKVKDGEPKMSGKLLLDIEYIELFTNGKLSRPDLGVDFAAEYISTNQTWDDVVLNPNTLQQISEIETWLKHNDTLINQWGMASKLKPGYRVLFHGPPGTGKTLTTLLLGKTTKRDVFRIDLSMVVSKFIGETEQNLAKLFDKAQNKDWILFFDEADALFGKRTNIRDAHDKYANQEVSYLLQRIENYAGLVILATNIKSNIDDAFLRRFQTIVQFSRPSPVERELLWLKAIPNKVKIAENVNLKEISTKYDLTGANIINVVQKMSLVMIEQKKTTLTIEILVEYIQKELIKEGKMI